MSEKAPIDHIVEIREKMGQLSQAVVSAEIERKDGRNTQTKILESMNKINERLAQLPDDEHREHHDFIRAFVDEHRERQRVRAAVISKITAGGAWATIVGLCILVWQGMKTKLGITG